MHPSEKITKQLTVRGGVNPYGQPDCKISVFLTTSSAIVKNCEKISQPVLRET